MSDNEVIKTKPPAKQDTLLQEQFYNSIANQAELMDKLAQTLIGIELAISGVYATALKLISQNGIQAISCAIIITMLCWFVSLIFCLFALLPKQYQVNSEELRNSEHSIENFFYQSARYKWKLLLFSILFFIVGIYSVIWEIVQ